MACGQDDCPTFSPGENKDTVLIQVGAHAHDNNRCCKKSAYHDVLPKING